MGASAAASMDDTANDAADGPTTTEVEEEALTTELTTQHIAIHLHINPFLAIALSNAVELVTEGTSSFLEYRNLAPHLKSFVQSLRDLTLTLAPSWGTHTRGTRSAVLVIQAKDGRRNTTQ
ncbi:hypothetical protein PIB30_084138 [Stylosanthes scabra]|uniref:Uncharacterized protein n=1 Tax=Stylosanthes scabra TaxID=79078 RepID=A0ABU6TS06_9FABA|nr:hypothetical protein [Stylosanthes scabra]